MGKKREQRRKIAIEAGQSDVSYKLAIMAINEVNRRIDRLAILVADHDSKLNIMSDKLDKCDDK